MGLRKLDRSDTAANVARLQRVLEHLRTGAPMSDEDRLFFADGVSEYLAPDGPRSLDKALGLRQRGGASVHRGLQLDERDTLLRYLVQTHPHWSALEPYVAARHMLTEFDAYEKNRWTRERRTGIAPDAEPFATFWRILKNGQKMPKLKRLRQILTREIQYPV